MTRQQLLCAFYDSSTLTRHIVPVVVLNGISEPVADQLLQHFEGWPRALGVKGGVQKGRPLKLPYHPCLSSGIDGHVVQLDLDTHTAVCPGIHHLQCVQSGLQRVNRLNDKVGCIQSCMFPS